LAATNVIATACVIIVVVDVVVVVLFAIQWQSMTGIVLAIAIPTITRVTIGVTHGYATPNGNAVHRLSCLIWGQSGGTAPTTPALTPLAQA
jgi:hypothetical protein